MKHTYINIFLCLMLIASFEACTSTQNETKTQPKNFTTLAPLTPFDGNALDGVLVSVADQVILLSDFQQVIQTSSNGQTQILANGKLVGGSLSAKQANQVLEAMIDQKTLEMKAQELGLTVSEDELSQRIQRLLKEQNYTEMDLQEHLKKNGKSIEAYRKEFKNEVIKQELIGRVISPLVTVTDDEVNSFYLQQTGKVKQISAIKLRSLMLNLPENFNKSPEEFDLVKKVKKELAAGSDFTDLVKKYSMATGAAENAGLLPPKPLNELPVQLREKLVNLKINDVIGPFSIGNSVFFFQYIGAEFSSGSDIKSNFVTWKNKLLNIKFEERLAEYLRNERTMVKVNKRPFVIQR